MRGSAEGPDGRSGDRWARAGDVDPLFGLLEASDARAAVTPSAQP